MAGSNKRRRGKILPVRCLDEEFNAIVAKADRAGLSAGAFLRSAGLGDAGPRAQRRPPADHVALRQLLGHVGRIGNNVNQIAKALNSGEKVDKKKLDEALRAYLEIRDAIFHALGKNTRADK